MDKSPVLRLHVFLSSPGDVSRERELAKKVMDSIESERIYRDRLKLEVVAWDKPGSAAAMPAHLEPQEAIQKGLKAPSQCDLVIVIFWARMGTPLSDKNLKPDGSCYRSGTEYEFIDALNAAKETGKPTVLVYRRKIPPDVSLADPKRKKKERQWELVEEFFTEFRNPDGSYKSFYREYYQPYDFKELVDADLRDLIPHYLSLFPSDNKTTANRPDKAKWDRSIPPFPGLQPFTADQAPIFFGRDREIDRLIEMVEDDTHRFLAVVGASGSGKSSLVGAGLLPALAQNAIPGSKDWVRLRFTPAERSDNPFVELAAALKPAMDKPGLGIREMAKQLRMYPEASNSYLETILAGKPRWSELLLFINQFEEFFTLVDQKYQKGFVDLLARWVQTPRVWIVVTLRSDFYPRGLDWPKLNCLLATGQYSLLAPGAGALYEMITRPAQYAGLRFENGLPNRIIDDTGTEPGALALMAFALRQLWTMSRDTNGLLTHEAYDSFDGVQGAIGQQAEATFGSLTGDKADLEQKLSDLFRQLVEVDEQGVPTRRRALRDEIARDGETAALTEKLTEARLLVTSGAQQNQPMVEVAHEAIFTHWERLKEWIEVRKDDLRLLRQVRLAAAEWEREGYLKHFLWLHERLVLVTGMVARMHPKLGPVEKQFILPESERLLKEINDPATSHQERVKIGDRLAEIGDPRPGVGLRPDGLPDITWCQVPKGKITLEDNAGTFRVQQFFIAQYPVTWIQYQVFLEAADGYRKKEWWQGLTKRNDNPGEQNRKQDNHPAENVSWYDAVAYCCWLSEHLGYKVRLPTEWEWQQATTGGNPTNDYPWGPEWDNNRANTSESGLSRTTAVGLYPKGVSPVGALDMAGNVDEWCLNEYRNPKNQGIGGTNIRSLHGGSWYGNQFGARAAFRFGSLPVSRDYDVGFRVSCASPIS